jgi:hypothetical protein
MATQEIFEFWAAELLKLDKDYGPLRYTENEVEAKEAQDRCFSIVFSWEENGNYMSLGWLPMEKDGETSNFPCRGYVLTAKEISQGENAIDKEFRPFIFGELSCGGCFGVGEDEDGEVCEDCNGEATTDYVVAFRDLIVGLPKNGATELLKREDFSAE